MQRRRGHVPNRIAKRFAPAFLAAGLGLGARFAIDPWLGTNYGYLTFFPAVALAGYYGDFISAMVTAALSVILADYFFIPPRHSFGPVSIGQWVAVTFYIIGAAAICLLIRSRTQALQEAQNELSERLRGQEAVRNAETTAAMGWMAAVLAHEINNPLAAITNLAYIVRTDPQLPGTLRDHSEMLDQELRRLGHIVRQTLNLYREHATSLPTVQLSQIIDEVLELYGESLRHVAVEKRYDSDCPINGSRAELHQLVSNVVLNAVEAIPESGGSIKIHICESCDWRNTGQRGIRMVVSDSGKGIDAEARRNIFRPFFTTKDEKGTGLGLSVVQWVATRYGGSVCLRSSTRPEHSGTCVSVFLCSDAVQKKASVYVGRALRGSLSWERSAAHRTAS